ncbi:MAG: hypothetical protein ACR5LA_07645 [Wolbachia sp.]
MHNWNLKENQLMSFQCVTLESRKEQWIPVLATWITLWNLDSSFSYLDDRKRATYMTQQTYLLL